MFQGTGFRLHVTFSLSPLSEDLESRDACYSRDGEWDQREGGDIVCLPCWKKHYLENHCERCDAKGLTRSVVCRNVGDLESKIHLLCTVCANQRSTTLVRRLKPRKDMPFVVSNPGVYIDGASKRGGWVFDESPWMNPFKFPVKATPEQVQEVLAQYEAHIRARPWLMARLPELAGRILSTWTSEKRCHGAVLVKLVKEWQRAQGFDVN